MLAIDGIYQITLRNLATEPELWSRPWSAETDTSTGTETRDLQNPSLGALRAL